MFAKDLDVVIGLMSTRSLKETNNVQSDHVIRINRGISRPVDGLILLASIGVEDDASTVELQVVMHFYAHICTNPHPAKSMHKL